MECTSRFSSDSSCWHFFLMPTVNSWWSNKDANISSVGQLMPLSHRLVKYNHSNKTKMANSNVINIELKRNLALPNVWKPQDVKHHSLIYNTVEVVPVFSFPIIAKVQNLFLKQFCQINSDVWKSCDLCFLRPPGSFRNEPGNLDRWGDQNVRPASLPEKQNWIPLSVVLLVRLPLLSLVGTERHPMTLLDFVHPR